MRKSLIPSTLLAVLCCLGFAVETRAQGITGYTQIDYYADTDTLDAYSETDLDWDLVGNYGANVSLAVIDDNTGSVISSTSARDWNDNGFISVESLTYGPDPATTYTALGTHRAYAEFWDDYSYEWPYTIWYYDNYYFTSFEGEGISEPLWYEFFSPGWQYFKRRSQAVRLGSTYDSDSASTPASPEILLNNAKVYEVMATFDGFRVANVSVKNSQHWYDICGNPNDTQPFTIRINFELPPGGQLVGSRCKAIPLNIPDQDYNIVGAVTCVIDDSVTGDGHMSIPAQRRYGGFADKNPGIHFTIGGNKSGQVGTIDTPGTVRVLCN